MRSIEPHGRLRRWLPACAAGALLPWSAVHAGKTINEHRAADPQGTVEVIAVTGHIDIAGWERPEIEVTGTAGDGVDRVEITADGARSTLRLVQGAGMHWGADDTHLTVHIPVQSALTASLVAADLKLANIKGEARLQSVSGNLQGEVSGDLHATVVSGEIHIAAPGAALIEVKSISGNIDVSGGGAEVEATTVSGDVKMHLGTLKRGRFKSISGDLSAELGLRPAGELDGESVSGGITLNFAGVPSGDYDVQSFAGEITNCFGPKPVEPRYGPGSRLQFRQGDGGSRVRIETRSGDVHVCSQDVHAAKATG
jgi:hypothetical protein